MKMYSAQDSGDLSRMLQCCEMGVRMRHGFSVQLSVGSISPSWLQYYQYLGHLPHISKIHGVNRRVRFGPKYVTLWTFSGAWPLISATSICNWRESRCARVLKVRPRKRERIESVPSILLAMSQGKQFRNLRSKRYSRSHGYVEGLWLNSACRYP